MNTRIIIIIAGLLLLCIGGYSQALPAGEKMKGNWEIIKMETTLAHQGDDRVLDRKILTAADAASKTGNMIPSSLSFDGAQCSVAYNGRIEKDSCSWDSSFLQLWELSTDGKTLVHYKSWEYSMGDAGQLVLNFPASFYMDPQRKIPVKRQVICTYNRKR